MSAGCLAGTTVAILAGGLGTRIRSVLGETPKALGEISGRPFIDYQIDWLRSMGASRVVLCLGHRAEPIVAHMMELADGGLEIVASVEPSPLGTAGALRFARRHFTTTDTIVMNGDTWLDADLCAFLAHHRHSGRDAAMLCVTVPDASRYGSVDVTPAGEFLRFQEKSSTAGVPGLVNGGIYAFSPAFLDEIAAGDAASLERDILQNTAPDRLAIYRCGPAEFIDIGTPESFQQAPSVIRPIKGSHGA